MSETSIRVATRLRIMELYTAAASLATADVRYGHPPEDHTSESIWLGEITGEVSNRTQNAVRQDRDDLFTITLWILAQETDADGREADQKCEALFAAIEDIHAVNWKLARNEGESGLTGLNWAKLSGPSDGPNSSQTDDGWRSVRSATITCSARLT